MTTNWILPIGVDDFNDKKASDWIMPFDNFDDGKKGVKSSLEEELNISMKTKDARTLEHWGKISSNLNSCFTLILTIEPTIPIVRMVSKELWAKLSPTMW